MITFFNVSFWQGLVTTFLGAFLAIPIGLYLNRCLQRLKLRQDKIQLRDALISSFESNLGSLGNLKEDLSNPDLSNYYCIAQHSFDLTLLKSSSLKKFDVFPIGVCTLIDNAIHHLDILERILKTIRNLIDSIEKSPLIRNIVRNNILPLLEKSLPKVKESIDLAKARLSSLR